MSSELTTKSQQTSKAANKPRSVFRPRSFWVKTCKAYKKGDLKPKQFIESEGLAYSTFHKWLNRLESEGALNQGSFVRVEVDKSPTLLAEESLVEVTADPIAKEMTHKTPLPTEATPDLKLTLNRGLVLSIPKHFDALTLRQIVESLEPC